MPFTAECYFCHVLIRNVPDHHRGMSKKCPRCKNTSTWAETSRTPSKSSSSTENRVLQAAEAHAVGSVSSKSMIAETPKHLDLAPSKELDSITVEPELDAVSPSLQEDQESPPSEALRAAPTFARKPFRTKKPKASAALFCFCFASCAFMTLSLSGAVWFALPLALLALVCGGVSLLTASTGSRSHLVALPGLAVALGVLATLAVAHRDVIFRGRARERSSPASGPSALVHLHSPGVTQRVEPKKDDWVDASEDAVQLGNVRVRVASVTVELPGPAGSAGRSALSEKRLVIRLRISNAGASQVVHYKGWNGDKAGLKLRDDQGTELRAKPSTKRGSGKLIAQADIPPEKWIDDDLVFEVPSSAKSSMRLELPGNAIGREDKLQFRIPGGMIQQRTVNTPAS